MEDSRIRKMMLKHSLDRLLWVGQEPAAAYGDEIFVRNKAKLKLASGTVLSSVVLASLLTELDCSSTTSLPDPKIGDVF